MKVKYVTQVISHKVANFIDVVMTLDKGKYLFTNIVIVKYCK